MPRFPVSPYWSSNPNIPIFLDQGEDREEHKERKEDKNTSNSVQPRHVPEHVCPTCETSSRDTPIHCVSVSPAAAPPSYNSITPQVPPYRQHLAVPTLTIETPRESWSRPQAPSRTLQIDDEGRPQVRFRRNAFSPLSPTTTEFDELDWGRKSQVGLGISDTPFKHDISPITPGTAERRGEERSESTQNASNFAQRVEQKLWNYTSSHNVVKRWIIEIISWTLSAACMAGICVMLFVYKNKTIPRWPLGLTLNAYISVLAKVASAALMLPVSEALGQLKWSWFQGDSSKKLWDFELFDSASRGPWGSFLLLVRTKGKTLAALGAAVTLMALALDPFFQQVVEYPEVWRLQEGQGGIQRAFGYEPFAQGQEFRNGTQNVDTDATMTGIAARFFYDNGTMSVTFGRGIRSEVPLACPHSNCTWETYETLGVHSECVDASDKLEFKCQRAKLDWVQFPNTDPEGVMDFIYPNGSSCGWWLKADKPVLMSGYNVDRNSNHSGETLIVRAEPLYDIFSRNFMPGYVPKLNNSRNPISHTVVASGLTLENIYNNATPIAHECIVSWAVKTLESSYSEGGYVEKVTDVFVNNTLTESPWLTRHIPMPNNAMDLWEYIYLENITMVSKNGNTYTIDNDTHLLTLSIFDDAFPSYYTLLNSTNEDDAMLSYKRWKTIVPYTRNVTYNPLLYNNISKHFDNMAEAMTNLLRSATNDVEMVLGPSYDQEAIVEVRWWWLSLPLSLLAFTGLFLLATILRSSKENGVVGVWKTSAIATILYGLPDHMTEKMRSEKEHGTPRAQAKMVKVKWIPKRGWRFSGASSVSPTSVADHKHRHSSTSSIASHKLRQSPPNEWI
ncbi:uncharacterized protein N0V89_007508 [Didymosphaeria variabile]|uniref:DUF3176 domain containing protein n=1 Tax=Didymosphaeria variabile TaxID=1932322 RepID=A0A9W8XL05_9PLEO|nr:uncharacterized protein N0V89_007508 [Didymosphaeria variabile]KAJ4352161.1 hypothetical protein N0V89_007508 [Didymosphaeria variabile]